MNKRRNQLVRRLKPSDMRRQVVFAPTQPAHPETQYVVSRTVLGEFAMHWTADWFAGCFSVTDLPHEWVAFVRGSVHGGWREAVWAGVTPFSCVMWDSGCPDRRVGDRRMLPGQSDPLPKQLAFRELRALPP